MSDDDADAAAGDPASLPAVNTSAAEWHDQWAEQLQSLVDWHHEQSEVFKQRASEAQMDKRKADFAQRLSNYGKPAEATRRRTGKQAPQVQVPVSDDDDDDVPEDSDASDVPTPWSPRLGKAYPQLQKMMAPVPKKGPKKGLVTTASVPKPPAPPKLRFTKCSKPGCNLSRHTTRWREFEGRCCSKCKTGGHGKVCENLDWKKIAQWYGGN